MSTKTCTCGREATHVRWDYRGRHNAERVPCCAFHKVHPTEPHPFDLHETPGWPHALKASA